MMIVSDTKRRILDVSNLIIIPYGELWEIRPADSNVPVAIYQTYERAFEVVKLFLEAYKKEFALKNNLEKSDNETLRKKLDDIVFYFPEE